MVRCEVEACCTRVPGGVRLSLAPKVLMRSCSLLVLIPRPWKTASFQNVRFEPMSNRAGTLLVLTGPSGFDTRTITTGRASQCWVSVVVSTFAA